MLQFKAKTRMQPFLKFETNLLSHHRTEPDEKINPRSVESITFVLFLW